MTDEVIECPFCGIASKASSLSKDGFSLSGIYPKPQLSSTGLGGLSISSKYPRFHGEFVSCSILICANTACGKQSLQITYTDDQGKEITKRIVPKSSAKHFEHIPTHI